MNERQRTVEEPISWQPYWRDAFRSVKRALLGRGRIRIGAETFRLAYEARGRAEQDDYEKLGRLVEGMTTVFDVGANVGLTSMVMASTIAAGGRVYAFEASEACCLVIRENLLLNGLRGRTEVVNAVISERSGDVLPFAWNFVVGNASAVMSSPTGSQITLSKCTLALDDFCETTGVSPEFLKIDVEGAERHVLAGMRRILSASRPRISMEVHGWPELSLQENASDILSILRDAEYQAADLNTGEPVRDADFYAARNAAQWNRAWLLIEPRESTPAGV